MPLALFPDAVPSGYVRVKAHLRRLTRKKKGRSVPRVTRPRLAPGRGGGDLLRRPASSGGVGCINE